MFSKLDQMLGEAPAAAQPKPKSAEIKPVPPPPPKPAPPAKTEPKVELSAKLEPPAKAERSAKTTPDSSRDMAIAPPAPAPGPPPGSTHDQATTPETDGYTIDEIRAASAGLFGQMSANLGSVIEHVFRNSGRPTGYILGTEGGGAFLAGVRYGKGTLYLRSGGTQQVFWHGPSLGLDVGGEGSKTLFLIYKMTAPEQLYSSFTGGRVRLPRGRCGRHARHQRGRHHGAHSFGAWTEARRQHRLHSLHAQGDVEPVLSLAGRIGRAACNASGTEIQDSLTSFRVTPTGLMEPNFGQARIEAGETAKS